MSIADNYRCIQQEVADAAAACGRDPSEIKIMAVSKTKPLSAVVEAYDAGIRLFGENRVTEGIEKFSGLANTLLVKGKEAADYPQVHLIGHLQRNKAKMAVFFNCIQSIDKAATAEALIKGLEEDQTADIFIEVNTSGESSKSGVHGYDQLRILYENLISVKRLKIKGLMTIAPFTDDEKTVRASFSSLREMSEKLAGEYSFPGRIELSMGMSGDFPWAIMEGSTLIRVGTMLFGQRD